MVKKHNLKKARRDSHFAWSSIPLGGFSCPKRRYNDAINENADAVSYIEKGIAQYRKSDQSESISEWRDLLCEASFGKGLAEGLMEMKEKTYKNRSSAL